jgi:DNA-binding MarR family transcriptional regulator
MRAASNVPKTRKAPAAAPGPKRRRFDSLEQEAFLNLWRSYDRLRALEDALFADYQLTAQQYNALRLLAAEHPATLPTLRIAGRLISRAPDITRLLDKLAERGLVDRCRQDGNRRVVQVGITQAGLKLLARLAVPVRRCHKRQLGHMQPAELRELITLLEAARRPHDAKPGAPQESASADRNQDGSHEPQ